jgi:hypothetical protein
VKAEPESPDKVDLEALSDEQIGRLLGDEIPELVLETRI